MKRYEYDGLVFDTPQKLGAYKKNRMSHEAALRRKEADEATRRPRQFVCRSCGSTFTREMTDMEVLRRPPQHCSKLCSNRRSFSKESRRRISEGVVRSHVPQGRKCIVCGRKFVPKSGGRRTCSTECMEHYRAHRCDFLSDAAKRRLREAGLKSSETQSERRRSRNETYFCELCEGAFENVGHNERLFNGWDADIILHDQKVAVLWNGNWHYKQIRRGTSLRKIQNRDAIKVREIETAGWTPYVIKDTGKHDRTLVEEEFRKFSDFVADINRK